MWLLLDSCSFNFRIKLPKVLPIDIQLYILQKHSHIYTWYVRITAYRILPHAGLKDPSHQKCSSSTRCGLDCTLVNGWFHLWVCSGVPGGNNMRSILSAIRQNSLSDTWLHLYLFEFYVGIQHLKSQTWFSLIRNGWVWSGKRSHGGVNCSIPAPGWGANPGNSCIR